MLVAASLGLFVGRASLAQVAGSPGDVSLASIISDEPLGVQNAYQNGLPARMDQFLRAVQSGHIDSVVAFFPRRGDWTYQRTRHARDGRQVGHWTFGSEDTPRAIRSGPLESSFTMNYEGQPVGSLVHQLKLRRGRWRQLPGSRFVPPGAGTTSDTFVSWRREDGAWVISTIADELYSGAKLPPWCC
jgi:hypothetical protein